MFGPVELIGLFGLAAALLYWVRFSRQAAASWPKTVCKAIPVPALMASVFLSGASVPWGLMLALFFCALGDIALSRDGQRAFLTGLGAFALGHLMFIQQFYEIGLATPRWESAVGVLAVAALAAGVLWRASGPLRAPVMIYVGLIGTMGLAGFSTTAPAGDKWIISLGVVSFMASDFALGLRLFRAPERWQGALDLFVWPTYCLGITAITIGITG